MQIPHFLLQLVVLLARSLAHKHHDHPDDHYASSPLDEFLAPVPSTVAIGGDLTPSFIVANPASASPRAHLACLQ